MTNLIKLHEDGFKKRQQIYPKLFDLNFWREQESYALIKQYCKPEDSIIEIGCLSAHHLVLLAQDGFKNLTGIDFVKEAIWQGRDWCKEYKLDVSLDVLDYPKERLLFADKWDKIILFDILEHVPNVGDFLDEVNRDLDIGGRALVLVPKGEHYPDEAHVNCYPNCEWLKKVLSLYFVVEECREVDDGKKLFAVCKKKVDE